MVAAIVLANSLSHLLTGTLDKNRAIVNVAGNTCAFPAFPSQNVCWALIIALTWSWRKCVREAEATSSLKWGLCWCHFTNLIYSDLFYCCMVVAYTIQSLKLQQAITYKQCIYVHIKNKQIICGLLIFLEPKICNTKNTQCKSAMQYKISAGKSNIHSTEHHTGMHMGYLTCSRKANQQQIQQGWKHNIKQPTDLLMKLYHKSQQMQSGKFQIDFSVLSGPVSHRGAAASLSRQTSVLCNFSLKLSRK